MRWIDFSTLCEDAETTQSKACAFRGVNHFARRKKGEEMALASLERDFAQQPAHPHRHALAA
jgi:hypothetical protein